jgi:putative ABC transport system permease protein
MELSTWYIGTDLRNMRNNENDIHKKGNNPPEWAHKLLQLFCAADQLEEVSGDLLEEYHYQVKLNGHRKAYWDYVISVAGFIQPFRRKRNSDQHSTPLFTSIMWKNYLTSAVRNFARNRVYSLINLAGLTLGLVSSMLIFQYVIFENSADSFHTKSDHLYRIAINRVTGKGTPEILSQIFLAAGETFKAEIPEVENFTRIRADFFQEGPTISYTHADEKIAFKDVRSIIVDSTFLNVFTFPLVRGDEASALTLPNSILVTESTAQRLFGESDPIGKTIEYSMNQGPQSLQVAGVLKDLPANSHIQFDVVIPLEHYLGNFSERQRRSPWGFREFTTYVQLRSGSDAKKVEAVMTDIIDRVIGEDLREDNTTMTAHLQPMKSLYFDRETDLGITGFGSAIVATRTGNERMVYFFTVIAIITLGIALMSYINLSTVRSLDRAKEVGIRKVVGAHKHNLKVQFFMESTLMNVTALVIAIVFVMLLMPTFNAFVQTNFTWTSWFNQTFLILFGTVFIVGALLSGLYPAFILSSFMPIVALKGKVGSFTSRSGLRKVFVVLQYAPAIALLVCTIVVYHQLDFMRNMDVGLEMDKLITIRSARFLPEGMISREAEAAFKTEIRTISAVESASYAGNQAGRGLNFLVPFAIDSAGQAGIKFIKGSGVDHEFADVFGLKLLAGEPFTEGTTPRSFEGESILTVLVNETTVRTWGIKKNSDAVARVVTDANGNRYYVQGVLEDFNWSSVHKATDPVMLWYTPNNRFMTIRIAAGADFNHTLAQIKNIYDKLFPMDVFHYEFADDVYNRQYGEDEKFARLFGIFSGMAILIASLGLFGLSAFSAERRSREVGIRKVMGANVGQIVRLLSKEFIVLVFISFLIASPIAWLVMYSWLQNFAFHIGLTAIPFLVAGLGAVVIAIITVSVKSMSVANTNPVKVLRAE